MDKPPTAQAPSIRPSVSKPNASTNGVSNSDAPNANGDAGRSSSRRHVEVEPVLGNVGLFLAALGIPATGEGNSLSPSRTRVFLMPRNSSAATSRAVVISSSDGSAANVRVNVIDLVQSDVELIERPSAAPHPARLTEASPTLQTDAGDGPLSRWEHDHGRGWLCANCLGVAHSK